MLVDLSANADTKRLVEWFCPSHLLQIHMMDELFASLLYSCVVIPMQALCSQVEQWSQATRFWFALTALSQIWHGYFGVLGPGLVSVSAEWAISSTHR